MSDYALDPLALTGRSDQHVQAFSLPDGSTFRAHPDAAQAFLAMRDAALAAGIDLAVSSAFRAFDDQALIWQRKWRGERVLLDADCQPIDPACLDDAGRVAAILEWSALPGASRHHWGSEFDVFDRAAKPAEYALQLVPAEYAADGLFAGLTTWLDANMVRFGFFRPYDLERGGVHPEPWHLSWAPVSVPALAALHPALLREAIEASTLAGRPAILARLDDIHACQVCRVGLPDASPAPAAPAPRKIVHVAAAVITRPDGSFLLGQRAPDTFYPGYWEFPGGKVEPGETPRAALMRELHEELGILVDTAWPWLTRQHEYEHAHVSLHFFDVPQWQGVPNAHVHSALRWQRADALDVGPMLPANGPILKALRLPRQMGVTHAWQIGVEVQLDALETALANGLRLVQIRESVLPEEPRQTFIREALARCANVGAVVVINGPEIHTGSGSPAGIHLTSTQLMACTQRPEAEWVGASCHSRTELEQAAALGLDYALLGHIHATASHPGQAGLGWKTAAGRIAHLPLPVLGIGGLGPEDETQAREHGLHGVAMIRKAWVPRHPPRIIRMP
jgi:8-oxo-dGTP diphosphatase